MSTITKIVSERLEILHQVSLFVGGKSGAVIVAAVGIAACCSIENVGASIRVTHLGGVIILGTAAKSFRPLLRGGEQFFHGADRTVVQIGGSRPNTIHARRPIFPGTPQAFLVRRLIASGFKSRQELVE